MKPELTTEEITRRFADIDSRPPEVLTPGEEASLAMAMADESASVSLDTFELESNMAHLRRGISALNAGKGVSHDIIEDDD